MSGASSVRQARAGKVTVDDLFDTPRLLASEQWQPFRTGISILPLYGVGETDLDRPSAALLHYQPGASVPEHEHTGFEHVIVLAGSQRDAQGVYPRGALVISEPGSRHAVASDDGCIVLVIWERPVRFVDLVAESGAIEGSSS